MGPLVKKKKKKGKFTGYFNPELGPRGWNPGSGLPVLPPIFEGPKEANLDEGIGLLFSIKN